MPDHDGFRVPPFTVQFTEWEVSLENMHDQILMGLRVNKDDVMFVMDNANDSDLLEVPEADRYTIVHPLALLKSITSFINLETQHIMVPMKTVKSDDGTHTIGRGTITVKRRTKVRFKRPTPFSDRIRSPTLVRSPGTGGPPKRSATRERRCRAGKGEGKEEEPPCVASGSGSADPQVHAKK